MRIGQIAFYSLAVKALFKARYAEIIAFDPSFTDPWLQNNWLPKYNLAKKIIMTDGMSSQNKDYTKQRNAFMNALKPILSELKYVINKCIEQETITQKYATFGLAQFNRSITKKSIYKFNMAYHVTISQINANAQALIDKGFTQQKIQSITFNHDKAWEIQNNRITLKRDISDLSIANQKVLYNCLKVNQQIINVIRAMAESTGNHKLKARATQKSILRSVSRTKAPKPRIRNINPASSIVISKRIPAKNIIQFTLLTDVSVKIYRTTQKAQPCEQGLDLEYNKTWQGHKTDIPGKGRFLKIYNTCFNQKARVRLYILNVKK